VLVAALGSTILGFVFLVVAVATGDIAWAWACIAVGAVGLVLLVVDVLRGRSRRADETDAAADTAPGTAAPTDAGADPAETPRRG